MQLSCNNLTECPPLKHFQYLWHLNAPIKVKVKFYKLATPRGVNMLNHCLTNNQKPCLSKVR